MFCIKCGAQLPDDAVFCQSCGNRIGGPDQSAGESAESVKSDIGINSPVNPDNQSTVSGSRINLSKEPVSETVNSESRSGNSEQQAGGPDQTAGSSGSSFSFSGSAPDSEKEKINIKELLTPENIERFAPVAALVPAAMMLAVNVLRIVLMIFLGWTRFGYSVVNAVMFILTAAFVLTPAAATGGLVYVVLNKKDKNQVNSWVAPAGTFIAFISCLCMAFGWGIPAFIFGLASFVLGLEFAARIVIENKPMESPMDPAAAFEIYKKFYKDYRAANPTTSELEKMGIADPENSKFDGSGAELFGLLLLTCLVSGVTCGIASPWMICKLYKWRIDHTVINGRRLSFNGTGSELLGKWILWEILTLITCGIYGFFMYVALRKWELSHTFIEDEPVTVSSDSSYFDGNSFSYFGYLLLAVILCILTCGIAYPWVMAMIQKWDTSHQVINRKRLVFSGTGLGFLGEFIIIAFLTLITLGIYSPWGVVRMNKYVIRNTDFE